MKISRQNSKKRSRNLKKKAKRLATYSAAAAATVAAQDRTANAGDMVHDIPDIAVDATADSPGLLFNVINGATTAPALSYSNSAPGSFRLAGNEYAYIAGPAFSFMAGFVDPEGFTSGYQDFRYPTPLGAGVAVGPDQTFGANSGFLSYGNYGYLSNFDGTKGFVGLRFEIGGSLHYGWAEITNVAGANGSILHGFGYNDQAGVVSVTPTVTTADFVFADLDLDKDVDTADWVIFRDNNQSDLSMLTPEEAYLLGDLDGDLDNDIYDFDLFRNAYEEANPGQALGSSVPEPSAMLLLAAGAAGLGLWRRRRAG